MPATKKHQQRLGDLGKTTRCARAIASSRRGALIAAMPHSPGNRTSAVSVAVRQIATTLLMRVPAGTN